MLTPCRIVCLYLIVTYTILAKVKHPDNKILTKELRLICINFTNPTMGWFEISEVPIIDQSSARIFQIFNEVWLSRYPSPRKEIFNNGSEFKGNFITSLKYFSFEPICTTIKNIQANATLEKIHQVFGSMLKTKYLVNSTFEAVDPCSDILASIVYAVQCVYHSTLQAKPRQLVFGRNIFLDISFQKH